jgi:Fur family ferric uptake transcriptional regulator
MAPLGRDEATALLERFRRYLREQHLPVTRQRDAVAEVLFRSEDHLAVEAIERRLRERGVRVGTATVYRTLDLLLDAGLARAHDFGEGYRRFEAMPARPHHGHLVCTRCGRVTEFTNEPLERILPIVADEHAFQHHRHRVEIYGLCRDCRQRDLGELGAPAPRAVAR